MGPLMNFVNRLLSMPDFASGRLALAYDKIFGKVNEDIDNTKLKKAIARLIVGESFPEDVLS